MNIEELRKQYNNLYSISISGVEYIFHSIGMKTFHELYSQSISASLTDPEFEDLLVGEALLFPEVDTNTCLAGIVTTIARNILEVSGLSDISNWQGRINTIKSNVRVEEDPILAIIFYITEAFPGYTIDMLLDMEPDRFLYLAALSDMKLELRNGKVGKQPNNPPVKLANSKKAMYRQDELESMSAEASLEALKKELSKVSR